MDWLPAKPHLHNVFASLGCQVGDQYVAHPNCLATLEHILNKLSQEDHTLRTFRRAVVFSNLIKKDLLQLLIAMKDDRAIISKTIQLFAELTTPVEKLLPVDMMSKIDAGRTTVIELNWLLFSAKDAFLEPKATQRVLDEIRMILSSGIEQGSTDEETLTHCISLIRNILHVPESRPTSLASTTSIQNRLIWNLFSQNFDKVLINLATRSQNGKWKIGVVQLVVLLYKDQQEIVMQKLLQNWMEATIVSESSEDNESNTSPPDHDSRESYPTSDSSDYDMLVTPTELTVLKCPPLHRKMSITGRKPFGRGHQTSKKADSADRETPKFAHRSDKRARYASMKTDSGCDTLGDNMEAVSTSSNDDSPERKVKRVHVKPGNMMHKQRRATVKQPLSPEEMRELKMIQLQRRALHNASLANGTVLYNVNLVIHKNPSNEDISHLLKEFTVDFLISAYPCIVEDLRRQLIDSRDHQIDPSQFFWLVTYFLKFAVLLELDYERIRPVLSRNVVTFLVYQGVYLCEQYENSKLHSDFDMTSRLMKQHLVVSAVREVLLAVHAYLNVSYITNESRQLVSQLQRELCEMEDLRNMFVMMLRQYNPDVHCKSYLIDLICTNHILIDFIDKCKSFDSSALMYVHLKQFTAIDIMKQYGHLLGCYDDNGPIINECIFTMMHHVAGSLDSLSSLFQPCIIRAFTIIYENGTQLLDDWADLIEYVIHQFIVSTKRFKAMGISRSPGENQSAHVTDEWSKEECDALFWYFVQSANSGDPVGNIIQHYSDSGIRRKTRIGLITQLLKQDIICVKQFNELMAKEPIAAVSTEITNPNMKIEVELLKDQLLSEGMEVLIVWLQKELLNTCHAKLALLQETEGVVEATPLHYTMNNEAIPLVPWNCDHSSAMQSHIFLLFLHKLGFSLPADTGNSFARIPKAWSPNTLYNLAQKLGPVPNDWVKFDAPDVQEKADFPISATTSS